MNSVTGLALALGGALVCLAIAAIVWWLNRTPAGYRRRPDPNLPLYSVGLSEMRRQTAAERATVTAGAVAESRVAESRVAESPTSAATAAERPTHVVRQPSPYAPSHPTPSVGTATVGTATVGPAPVGPPSIGTPTTGTASNGAQKSGPVAPARAPSPVALPPDQPISANGVPGTQVEGHMLRFTVPQEGTLQFLPGRLEIASGLDEGREIRFVRVPGPNGTEVTFGRSEGPAYRHIQLREGTVSRAHARMRLLEGHWHLCNLSSTNPVVHNGKTLTDGEEQQLADGDRIEMGEVVFGFRSR